MGRDYYATLGVARDASGVEVKAAYRKLAWRWHPDRNMGDAAAEERFKELSEAYAVLSDELARSRYDRFGTVEAASPFGGAAGINSAAEFFQSLFGDLFGLGRRNAAAGRDLRYTLELDFEEAAAGCEKTIAFDRAEDCATCRATGAEGGAAGLLRCARCGGDGFIRGKPGWIAVRRECAACGGAGEVPRVRCAVCDGAGLVERRREYVVRVPSLSTDGSSQRIPSEGSPGRRGGPAGDLHVIVRVRPHAFFSREGDLLACDVPISIVDATLGADIDVPVLGGQVRMKVPPGTQSGAVFRIRGKGLPRANGSHPAQGDVHVRIAVETPSQLSDQARALLVQLGQALEDAAHPRQRDFRLAAGQRAPAPLSKPE